MKKKYFDIDVEVDEDKWGDIPQIFTLRANEDFSKDEFLESLNTGTTEYYDSYCFEFSSLAIPSDVLSNWGIGSIEGLFLSEKVKRTLSKFEIPFAQFYPVKIKRGNDFLTEYYFLHLLRTPHECFDFSASSFLKWTIMDGVIGNIEINSHEEYKQKGIELIENLVFIAYKEIYVTPQFNKNTAMFRLNLGTPSIYISEKLKDELIKDGITGLKFNESARIVNIPN